MRVKISDGVREVEIEGDGDLSDIESAAKRLYAVVTSGVSGKTPVGFSGWSTVSEHERQPDEE